MTPPNPRKKTFYANSSVQVLFAIGAAITLGYPPAGYGNRHETAGRRFHPADQP